MHLPLRVKLILVMSVVVTGATVGTALVSMGVVRKAYENKFESDFKAEVRYFSQRELERLDAMKGKCRNIAEDAAMITALQKRESSSMRTVVLSELKDFYTQPGPGAPLASEGREFGFGDQPLFPRGAQGRPLGNLGKGGKFAPPEADKRQPTPLAKSARQGQGPLERPSVAIVDEEGNFVCGVDQEGKLVADESHLTLIRRPTDRQRQGEGGGLEKAMREAYKQKLKQLAERVGEDQEVCYTAGRSDDVDGRTTLQSLIVTPVFNKESSAAIGAVILRVRSDLGERELHSFSQETDTETSKSEGKEAGISSGFWLDGELHTRTIPVPARELVKNLIAARVGAATSNAKFHEANLSLPEDGHSVPHKLIFRVLNPDSPFPPTCQVALYSLKDEISEERSLQQKVTTIGLLALAVALVCVLILSRNFTRPIRDLVVGTEQIRSGNYDVKVNIGRRDELGQLAVSFNEMAEGLRMNQKYQRLLSQVADRLVAEQLINNEAALGGELREVSVLFCDIRGFTKITAGMQPGEIIAMLNEHMTALTEVVHAHHGVVDKFVGDMVMALFGAPSARGDDAKRAALCALRMVEVREKLNVQGEWHMQVGIGIATGTVVAGCMGSEERLDYTVLGERVNLASRLCRFAAPGEVLIDDGTRQLLGPAAHTEVVPDLALKGFDEAVTAYRLCSASDSAAEQAFDSTALVQAQV